MGRGELVDGTAAGGGGAAGAATSGLSVAGEAVGGSKFEKAATPDSFSTRTNRGVPIGMSLVPSEMKILAM